MSQSGEEPSHSEPRIQLAGALKMLQRFGDISKIVELHHSQFQIGLRIVRHFDDLLASQFPIEDVLSRASFLVRGEAEMMDQNGACPRPRPDFSMLGPTLSWTRPTNRIRASRRNRRTFSCST